jgi:hypothetical protein
MRFNAIRNANIHAIAIVDKGANRKTFFLRKADAENSSPLGYGRMVKAEDWSAVYCVVAEPGWAENSGIGGPDLDDVWASEEEIRKAAHQFMANGGLVNKMHESLEPYGQLVENAVALADFTVNGETIRKGSWYIAITPSADGKVAIEKGEFTGVSIEGTAVREMVEKGEVGEVGLVGVPGPAGSTPAAPTVGSMEKTLLRKIAEKVGLSPDEVEAVEKADRTFGELIAYREFDEILPDALDAFRDAVWYAFFPTDPGSADPVKLITESCDEFKAWALDKLDTVPVAKEERAEALGVTLDGSTPRNRTVESEDTEMGLTAQETERIEKLETAVEKIGAGVEKLIEKAQPEPEAPTVESLSEQVEGLTKTLGEVKDGLEKLGSGGSSQTEDPPADEVEKADDEAVKKAFEREGVNPNLAGVL